MIENLVLLLDSRSLPRVKSLSNRFIDYLSKPLPWGTTPPKNLPTYRLYSLTGNFIALKKVGKSRIVGMTHEERERSPVDKLRMTCTYLFVVDIFLRDKHRWRVNTPLHNHLCHVLNRHAITTTLSGKLLSKRRKRWRVPTNDSVEKPKRISTASKRKLYSLLRVSCQLCQLYHRPQANWEKASWHVIFLTGNGSPPWDTSLR